MHSGEERSGSGLGGALFRTVDVEEKGFAVDLRSCSFIWSLGTDQIFPLPRGSCKFWSSYGVIKFNLLAPARLVLCYQVQRCAGFEL